MRFLPFLLLLLSCTFNGRQSIKLDSAKVHKIEIGNKKDSLSYKLNFDETATFIKLWNKAIPKGPMKYIKKIYLYVYNNSGDTIKFGINETQLSPDFKALTYELMDKNFIPQLIQKLTKATKKEVTAPIDPIHKAQKQGYRELKNAEISDKSCPSFPCCDCEKVMVYEITPREEGWPEDVFRERTDSSKTLSKTELAEFLTIINSPASYGNSFAACHIPRIGLVCYNAKNEPCSYLSLCLECNNLKSQPDFRAHYKTTELKGFSDPTRKKLRQLFARWGFPDNSFSPLFD